jgi:CBS domain-containing protein
MVGADALPAGAMSEPTKGCAEEVVVLVRDAMSSDVLTIGPDHSLRDAARLMHERKVGSVVVVDPDVGVGLLSERTVVSAVAAELDPSSERAADHIAHDAVYASPSMTLEEATEAMRRGGYRHLVVLDGNEVIGLISMRDIVRAWQPTTVR